MKKYIRKEIIKAKEMNMEEAYKNKLLPNKKMLHDFEKNKNGFLIENEDGSKKWVSEFEFQKLYKSVETPIDRMLIEYDEEFERYQKGEKFINSDTFKKLKDNVKILLSAQNQTQKEYCYLLNDRIRQMSNQLPILSNFDFGTALKILKAGGAVKRSSWEYGENEYPYVFCRKILQDLVIETYTKISNTEKELKFEKQLLILNKDNTISQWSPSCSDIFATDWTIINR